MLPPVTATNGPDVTFSNLPAQQSASAKVTVAGKLPLTDEQPTASTVFAKANLSALSSQLQFAQNVTMLADAIGKLIDLPKLEGETPRTYVMRLVATINTLSVAQRSALEAQINKILPGLTLSILVDTLKNPTGPQAARLALLLETAPHRGSDLVAKAVVSSYRQNIGSDQRLGNQILQSPANAPSKSANVSSSATQPVQSTQNEVTGVKSNRIAATAPFEKPQPSNDKHAASVVRTPGPDNPAPARNQSATHANSSNASALARQPAASSQTMRAPSAHTNSALHISIKPETAELPAAPATATPSALSRSGTLTSQTEVSITKPHELATVPETSKRHASQGATPHRGPLKEQVAPNKEGAAAMFNPVAALITAITTAKLPDASEANQSLFASLIGLVKSSIKDLSFSQTSMAASQSADIDDMLGQLAHLPKNEIQNKLIEAIKHLPPDHPQVQALLMSALRNEIVPAQPYVNYPLAEDEYESESHPRGQWSSSGDEETFEEQGDAEPEDEQDEIVDAAPTIDAPLEEHNFLDVDEPTERQAENYYLRMSNFL